MSGKTGEDNKKLADIRNGSKEIDADGLVGTIASEPRDKNFLRSAGAHSRRPKNARPLPRGILWGVGGLILFFIGGFVLVHILWNKPRALLMGQADTLQAGVQDLQKLDFSGAAEEFAALGNDGSSTIGQALKGLQSVFGKVAGPLAVFKDLAGELNLLSADVHKSGDAAFHFAVTGSGADLVKNLQDIRSRLAALDRDSAAVGSFANLSPTGAGTYIPLRAELTDTENFLDKLIPWLTDPAPRHILVLLQNPSEIRPAGGFLGSYADVTLKGGDLTDVSIHDIADVDLAFKPNIIPPKPLQLEVPRFRPADANWFFDFPTSAAKVAALFERSGLYADQGTTFDGVIAVSPKVVSDLLSLTGPITVQGENASFSSDNFLVEIQKIVQAGQATSATYPKKIVGELFHSLFQNLASLSDDKKQKLFGVAADWFDKKDIMIYMKNPDFQNFSLANGAGGEVYQLPANFNGEYLAVVNTNILGDKSDQYVSQDVMFEAGINADGTATDHLIITRTHTGDKSPYWWYRTTNQDYLQIFAPPKSTLTNATGGIAKNIAAPMNYANKGYEADPQVAAIASSTQPIFGYPAVSSHDESGKQVFATWSVVKAGTSATTTFDYTHRLFSTPRDGTMYTFVFDKQAGTTGHYVFEVNAPLGYKFLENNLASYRYESSDPPGRVLITLTLGKI